MGKHFLLICLLIVFSSGSNFAQSDTLVSEMINLEAPSVPQAKIEHWELNASTTGSAIEIFSAGAEGSSKFSIDGTEVELMFKDGRTQVPLEVSRAGSLHVLRQLSEGKVSHIRIFHISKKEDGNLRIIHLPLWLSILPPLVAIILALVFKEVIVSLFAGIWLGAFIAGGLRFDSLFDIFFSFFEVIQKYMITALSDSGHLSVILFSLLIGGMVALISKNGGMAGVVDRLSRYANNRGSSQIITWVLGIAIFFDDYANTLIVGNTMRSVTDKFRISREKLAYIVDSTAAPVSAIALITTWIGAELGFIDSGMRMIDGFGDDSTPYALFLASLKYSFYPVLTLGFVYLLIRIRRDFGPMLKAEQRAFHSGQLVSDDQLVRDDANMEDLSPVSNAPRVWWHAGLPVILVILTTILGLLSTGFDAVFSELVSRDASMIYSWSGIWGNMHLLEGGEQTGTLQKIGVLIGKSDSYQALIWASFTGVLSAILISVAGKTLSMKDSMHYMTLGFKTMLPALIILVLAWSLAIVTDELHTADFITLAIGGRISPYLMPALIFILAALISFSTGSSWSTMAILYPIALPTTWALCELNGLSFDVSHEIMLNVIATVLGASVLGDHCSPISDTTILSSLASDCNHIDHVRTQLPYALLVGSVSLVCTSTVNLLGGSWLLSFGMLVAGFGALYGFLRFFGRPVS